MAAARPVEVSPEEREQLFRNRLNGYQGVDIKEINRELQFAIMMYIPPTDSIETFLRKYLSFQHVSLAQQLSKDAEKLFRENKRGELINLIFENYKILQAEDSSDLGPALAGVLAKALKLDQQLVQLYKYGRDEGMEKQTGYFINEKQERIMDPIFSAMEDRRNLIVILTEIDRSKAAAKPSQSSHAVVANSLYQPAPSVTGEECKEHKQQIVDTASVPPPQQQPTNTRYSQMLRAQQFMVEAENQRREAEEAARLASQERAKLKPT